jgi:hypothetical protein
LRVENSALFILKETKMITPVAILMIILGLIACGMFMLLLAPVTFRAEFAVSAAGQNGVLYLQLLHPALAQWKYDVERRRSEIKVLWWTRVFPDTKEETVKTKETLISNHDTSVYSTSSKKPHRKAPEVPHEELGIDENRRGTNMAGGDTDPRKEPAGHAVSGWHKITRLFLILNDRKNRKAAVKALRWCRRTLRHCFSVVRLHRFRFHAKAGVSDPAETGKIYGYYAALAGACLSPHRNIDVHVTPEFSGDLFECDGSVAMRTSLTRIVLPFFSAFVTFPYITVYFMWRRLKKTKSQGNGLNSHA